MNQELYKQIIQNQKDKIDLLDTFINGLNTLEDLIRGNNTSEALKVLEKAQNEYIKMLIINNDFIINYDIFPDNN